MFIYALLTAVYPLLLLPQIVSAQPPSDFTSTCPVGYFCAFGTLGPDTTTAFTFGQATTTAPAQPIPTIPGIVQVDDTDPLIQYTPSILWQSADVGGCPTCFGNPPPNQTFNRTWHEGRRTLPSDALLTVTFNFTGTGVSVYAILPATQLASNLDDRTSVSFLVDGEPTSAANWTWNPPPFNPSNWNVSVNWFQQEIFNSPQLSPGDHSIQMTGASQGWSWFLLDYIAYRTDNATQTETLSSVVTPPPGFDNGVASVTQSGAAGFNSATSAGGASVSGIPAPPENATTTGRPSNGYSQSMSDISISLFWAFISGSFVLF
ncbi:hypothetical protein K439DRAFT_1657699 [Ramaria rubella]|nr:hypothetical protein K439DRAFT_1657699 [Ramaria rubella]